MLRVTFGSQREKVAANSRKLHHKKLRDFEYYSSDQIKDNEMSEARSTYREEEGDGCRVLVETYGKEPLRRPRRRRENNIKVDLQEIVVMVRS